MLYNINIDQNNYHPENNNRASFGIDYKYLAVLVIVVILSLAIGSTISFFQKNTQPKASADVSIEITTS